MFLRCTTRKKNGKEHRYWNLVENRRVAGGQVVQRQVLYLGEINDSQREVWRKSIEVFEDGRSAPRTVALFAEEQTAPIDDEQIIQVRLKDLEVRNARQWGGCWLVCELYEQLKLDQFWAERLPPGRKGTRWDLILQTLCIYRFIEPGSEWRLHRYWFDRSAVPELLGSDFRLAESHRLYECHDLLLKHKGALFTHLTERWKDLFNAKFEILLYDLTSTYFECDPPIGEADKRKFGHSRDKRSDCVQVVIALIVTPEGFPLAYEVLAGNTSDKTTLRDFLKKIEAQYGKAERTWVLDRGIPTEEVLAEMRNSEPPIYYLVGTPKSRLSKLEAELIGRPWEQVRPGLDVKLLAHEGELYVQAQSQDRVSKERAMRRRRLRKLWNRLGELQKMKLNTKALLIKIGEAKKEAGRAFGLIDLKLPNPGRSKKRTPKTKRPKGKKPKTKLNFSFRVNRDQVSRNLPARRPIPAAGPPCSASPSHALGILHPAHGSRGSLQKSEGRFRDSPHFSSASPSHRGTHLHRLSDLLSSCHSAPALARLGARINSSCRPGEVQRDADDRCSSSHHRRPDHHPFALHPTRGRPSAPAKTTQTGITRAAAAQNHGLRPTGQIGLCSEDFLGAWVDFERLTIDVPLESARTG